MNSAVRTYFVYSCVVWIVVVVVVSYSSIKSHMWALDISTQRYKNKYYKTTHNIKSAYEQYNLTETTTVLSQPVHETATYKCDDTRGCVMQFWPPDYEHMCSKHVEAWNKLTVKQKFCASSWLITEINILRCMVSKTSKKKKQYLFKQICMTWTI